MIDRLKRAVVGSYVGAIALGYLLAQAILHFAGIFSSPVADLVAQSEFRELTPKPAILSRSPLQDALPELVRFLILLLVWYVLLRWLYFKPLKKETSEPASTSE